MRTIIRDLAEVCGAEVLGGNLDKSIDSAANVDEARVNQLTFISSIKHVGKLESTAASAVIVPKGTSLAGISEEMSLLAVGDPELAFIACLRHLYPAKPNPGTVCSKAQIDPSATIGEGTFVDGFAAIGAQTSVGTNCRLFAGCRIGDDVTIGDNCVLYPNVVLYDGVTLGDNVIVHAGAVIGADGYGYKFRSGEHIKFPQVGTVVVESNVEIGANTCIDRASLGVTRIGKGTKIDNQVHIAHNVNVGEYALLLGQVGIGGSSVIEDYAVLVSQCGVADHITVGKGAMVLAQAGVTKDVMAQDQVMGFPAVNRKEALREMAALRRLAGGQKAIEELIRLLPRLRDVVAGELD